MTVRPVLFAAPVAVLACGGLLGADVDDPPIVSVDAAAGDADAMTASGEAGPTDGGRRCLNPASLFCQDFDLSSPGPLDVTRGGYVETENSVAIVAEGRSLPNAVAVFGKGAGHAI